MSKKIPQKLQGALWSYDVKKLDIEKNKNYITHQILMYGDLNDIKWLLKTYPKKVIKQEFLKKPQKIYTAPILNFVKTIILNIKQDINKKNYVKTIY